MCDESILDPVIAIRQQGITYPNIDPYLRSLVVTVVSINQHVYQFQQLTTKEIRKVKIS